jgi:hypothetical protein
MARRARSRSTNRKTWRLFKQPGAYVRIGVTKITIRGRPRQTCTHYLLSQLNLRLRPWLSASLRLSFLPE